LPTYQQIANDYEGQCSYLISRCLKAEGKDPDDVDALREIVGAAMDASESSGCYARPAVARQ
jgi:hypothetical protein